MDIVDPRLAAEQAHVERLQAALRVYMAKLETALTRAEFAERALQEFGHWCDGCKRPVDPDTCGCGDAREWHVNDGHSFIPDGCDCGRVS